MLYLPSARMAGVWSDKKIRSYTYRKRHQIEKNKPHYYRNPLNTLSNKNSLKSHKQGRTTCWQRHISMQANFINIYWSKAVKFTVTENYWELNWCRMCFDSDKRKCIFIKHLFKSAVHVFSELLLGFVSHFVTCFCCIILIATTANLKKWQIKQGKSIHCFWYSFWKH